MPVQTKRGAATRQRLLDAAAAQLIAHDGALEVEAVAVHAGVSIGLMYRYFGSKAGLVAAVVEAFYDRCDRQVMDRNPIPGADWGTRERERTARYVAFLYNEPLAPVIYSRLGREPDVAAIDARRVAGHVALAARNIARGQQRGEIPAHLDAGLAGAMVIGGLRQAVDDALAREQRPDAETLIEELWRFIVAAVRFRPVADVAEQAGAP